MTIATAPTPLSYAGNGSTTAFPISWKYNSTTHVVATLRSSAGAETVWVVTTNYTITAAGDTGTLTAVVAPATGTTLLITLEPPNTQSSDIPLGGDFPSVVVEDGLDLAAQRDGKLEALFLRALRVPKTDTQTGSLLEIPIDSLRASKFLAFDASGKPISAVGASNLGPVTAFVNTALDDPDALTFRGTISAVGLTGDETVAGIKAFTGANTHSGIETHSNAEVFSGTPSINLTGGQIKFPATQVPSADANTMDDYEEGTWNITAIPGTSGSITLSINTGYYTKIGRIVMVYGFINVSSVSSPVGSLDLTGFPFSIIGNSPAFAIHGNTLTGLTNESLQGSFSSGSQITIGTFLNGLSGNAADNIQAGTQISFSGVCFV